MMVIETSCDAILGTRSNYKINEPTMTRLSPMKEEGQVATRHE
jgi:hypothetical protein